MTKLKSKIMFLGAFGLLGSFMAGETEAALTKSRASRLGAGPKKGFYVGANAGISTLTASVSTKTEFVIPPPTPYSFSADKTAAGFTAGLVLGYRWIGPRFYHGPEVIIVGIDTAKPKVEVSGMVGPMGSGNMSQGHELSTNPSLSMSWKFGGRFKGKFGAYGRLGVSFFNDYVFTDKNDDPQDDDKITMKINRPSVVFGGGFDWFIRENSTINFDLSLSYMTYKKEFTQESGEMTESDNTAFGTRFTVGYSYTF